MTTWTRLKALDPARRQAGSALIIALVFLLVMTLLGVASMQTTTLQERMAANAQDRVLAFQAAEAALRDGEAHIMLGQSPFTPLDPSAFNGQNGLFTGTTDFALRSQLANSNLTIEFGSETDAPPFEQGALSAQPRYLIELMDNCLFRVTARAQGANPNTVVIVQSRFNRCGDAPPGCPGGPGCPPI